MLIDSNQKVFENPDTGVFNGTIVDIVDLGPQQDKYGKTKVRLRVVWVLDKNDSEGRPFRAVRHVNAVITDKPKKSNLYEVVEGVLGTAPPVLFDTEALIGRSNELWIARETDPVTKKVYANIKMINPLKPGVVPPPIPQGFVRDKDKRVNTIAQAAAPAVVTATTSYPASAATTQPQPVAVATQAAQATAPTPVPTAPDPSQQQQPAPQPEVAKVEAAF